MTNKKDWFRINQILRERKIDPSQAKHISCIRMHPTESDEHFNLKCQECRKLFKAGIPFLTEAWTLDKKRYDILDLCDNIDLEIESGKSKKKKYTGDIVLNTSGKDS